MYGDDDSAGINEQILVGLDWGGVVRGDGCDYIYLGKVGRYLGV